VVAGRLVLAGRLMNLMPAWFHGKPTLTFRAAGFDPELALSMMAGTKVRNVLLTPTVLKLLRPVPDPRHRSASLCGPS